MRCSFFALLATLAALSACSSSGSDMAPAADPNADFMTWTQDGKTYHATDVSAFTYKTMPVVSINGGVVPQGQAMSERTLTLSLPNTQLKPGTYPLVQSKTGIGVANGQLVLVSSSSSMPRAFNTLAGPAASNGTLILTECDPKAQRLVGTFQFTAQEFDGAPTSTQTVTAGSFRLTKLQEAPNGM